MASRTLGTILGLDFNLGPEGIENVIFLTSSQFLSKLKSRTLYVIQAANADITITVAASADATKGAYSFFQLEKNGTGNAIISSTSSIDGSTSQTITDNRKGIGMQDKGVGVGYAIVRDTRGDSSGVSYEVNRVSASTAEPVKEVINLVDASTDEVNITLPQVLTGNEDWYWFTLENNGNHCNISAVAGQVIKDMTTLSLSTETASVLIKANGVDGYDILLSTRVNYKIISVDADLGLLTGFESGGYYEASPADATEITITLKNWSSEHIGDSCKFTKKSGENSTVRVVSQDSSFDETINVNQTGFELVAGDSGYFIGQDSRQKDANITINYYPVDVAATLEPTYKKLLTKTSDPDYPIPSDVLTTAAINSIDPLNPQSLGFFIDDGGALTGFLSERSLNAVANVSISAIINRFPRFKFKYYSYDISTAQLEPLLSNTGYSELIVSDQKSLKLVSGIIPDFDWTGKTLVIELLAYKDAIGGTDPILVFETGGSSPSKTTVDIPATSVNHDSLAGAGTNSHASIDTFLAAYNADTSLDANILYVGKFGNNSTAVWNDQKRPWLNIQEALNAAKAGDLVWVYPGIYDEYCAHPYGVNMHFESDAIMRPSTAVWPNSVLYTEDPATGSGNFFISGNGKFEATLINTFPYHLSAIYLQNLSGNPQRCNLEFHHALNVAGDALVCVKYPYTLSCKQLKGGYDQTTLLFDECNDSILNVDEITDYYDPANVWNGQLTLYIKNSENIVLNSKYIKCNGDTGHCANIFNATVQFNDTIYSIEKHPLVQYMFLFEADSVATFNNCTFNLTTGVSGFQWSNGYSKTTFLNCIFNIDDVTTFQFLIKSFAANSADTEFINCKINLPNLPAGLSSLINLSNNSGILSFINTVVSAKDTTLVTMIENIDSTVALVNNLLQMTDNAKQIFKGSGTIENVNTTICGLIDANLTIVGQTLNHIDTPINI
jgi:hypothetical protein